MQITKDEFKKLSREFLVCSNRVLRAPYEDYNNELRKFISYLESKPIIIEFIKSCGEPEFNAEEEINEIIQDYGRSIFVLGESSQSEVANIFSVLKQLVKMNVSGRSYVFYGYSTSKKYQDKVDAFGDKYIKVLVNHIEEYLYNISVDMGIDSSSTTVFNISGGQVNIANDNSTVNATQNNGIDVDELDYLIENVLKYSKGLTDEDKEILNNELETIKTVKNSDCKKGYIKAALKTIKAIKGTAEFMTSIVPLIQLVMQYVS